MNASDRQERRDGETDTLEQTISDRFRAAGRLCRTWVTVLLAMLLGVLLIAELALRAAALIRGWTTNCYAPYQTIYQCDPRLGFGGLKPGYRFRDKTMAIGVNALGFRGPEFPAEKPPDTYRIFLVGGSAVFGYHVSDDATSSAHLQRYLQAHVQERRIEVINAGVPGYNTMHTLVRFLYRIRPLEPDLVVYYQGFNDLSYITRIADAQEKPQIFGGLGCPPWHQRLLGHSTLYGFLRYRMGLRPEGRATPAMQLQDEILPSGLAIYEQNLRLLMEAVRLSGSRIVICSQATLARKGIGESERRFLAGHFGLSESGLIRAMQELRSIQQKVATDEGIPFVDADNAIPPRTESLGDVLHLTARGEQQLAELLGDSLLRENLLEDRRDDE